MLTIITPGQFCVLKLLVVQSLAWKLPYATDVAIKLKKKKSCLLNIYSVDEKKVPGAVDTTVRNAAS